MKKLILATIILALPVYSQACEAANARQFLIEGIENRSLSTVKRALSYAPGFLYNDIVNILRKNTSLGSDFKQLFANYFLFYWITNDTTPNAIHMRAALNGTLHVGAPKAQITARHISNGESPAMVASVQPTSNKLNILMTDYHASVGPSTFDNNHTNTLMYAASMGRESAMNLVASHYDRTTINNKNSLGRTALMLAALYGSFSPIKTLVSTLHANPSIKDNKGYTALTVFSKYSNQMYLYKRGPNGGWVNIPALQVGTILNKIIRLLSPQR